MATKNDITRLSGSGLNQGFEPVQLQQAKYSGDMATGGGYIPPSGGDSSFSLKEALGMAGQAVGLAAGIDQLFSGGYRQREAQRQQLKNQMILNQQSQDFAIEQMIKSGEINLLNSIAINERYNTVAAKKKQYLAAGMNPALAMGLGAGGSGGSASVGGTGPAGAHGGQAQGIDPSSVGRNNVEAAMMLSQMQLNKSLARKADADGVKATVEAEKTSGVDTQKATAEIGEIAEKIENMKVQREGERLENELREVRNMIARATAADEIKKVEAEVDIMKRTYDKMLFEMQKTAGETKKLRVETEQMKERFVYELRLIQADIVQKYASSDSLMAQARFTDEEKKYVKDKASALTNMGVAALSQAGSADRMAGLAERMEGWNKVEKVIGMVGTTASAYRDVMSAGPNSSQTTLNVYPGKLGGSH